ncbi:hypothetical protein HYH03_007181 [Edaphochlamys debaryana]|uniref:EGF-like domain-containing protein n=1 Tax=Edaphochlamys debaryana TaxID=47281 RepID=A0A836BZH0_9CHLO|nr:hypothetical protein HYH03_007181 [Edaphochlamys debaryana]|eukprot:KAG2494665.1 hypothetical protein HYH03_007181 [Edaphochlamys debaryana]
MAGVCGHPNATCAANATAVSGYTCTCPTGFTPVNDGAFCIDSRCYNYCPDPATELCSIDASGKPVCTCKPGLVRDTVTGKCVRNLCLNFVCADDFATCAMVNGKATCVCKPGYAQDLLLKRCVEDLCPRKICLMNEVCVMRNLTATCICRPLYVVDGTLHVCVPNTCLNHPCSLNENCVVVNKIPSCICKPDYVKDLAKQVCVRNLCTATTCKVNEVCSMYNNATRCTCRSGLIVNPHTGLCERCDLLCTVNAECTFSPTTGEKICTCKQGFLRDLGSGACVVNKCLTTTFSCPLGQHCAIRLGNLVCVCNVAGQVIRNGVCVMPA